jgi:hypothetical protein
MDDDEDVVDDDEDVVDETKCVTCQKGRDVVCIRTTHYGFCDEGCAEPRRLKESMKCVDGKIYGARG